MGMSYTNPTSTQYMPPQPPKTSGAAITSLVCGLLLCIPVIPQLIAIITGFIGLKSAGKPGMSGRGLAIAGLVLGFIGLLGWVVGGGLTAFGVGAIFKMSAPMVADCKSFTTDLANGNVDSAYAFCDSSIPRDEIKSLSDTVQKWGSFTDLSLPVRKKELVSGTWYWSFSGAATFSSGVRTAEFEMRQQTDGSFKINSVEYK